MFFAVPATLIQILIWLPTILFCTTLIFHMISGARRGLSKSVKLFITFTISIIIAIIFYFVVKNLDFNTLCVTWGNKILNPLDSNMTKIMQIIFNNQNISEHNNLIDYFSEGLSQSQFFKESSQGLTLEEAAKLLYSLSLILINIVIFILALLVFFVSKFILYIFYLIFFKEGRRRDKINKKYQDGEIDYEYRPHRFLGMLVGLFRGVIVGTLIVSIFGINSYIVSTGKDEGTVTDKSQATVNSNFGVYATMYEVVSSWGTKGVNQVLSQAKNKENVPFYLIVADQLLTTDYTYEEDGVKKTISLHVTTDLAPLTSAISNSAYLMIMYGFNPDDYQGEDSGEKLANFLTSDKKIDGLTLEERINGILKDTQTGDYSSYLVDKFVMSYVSKMCDVESESDPKYQTLELSNKLLYQLFLGKHKINASSFIDDGNMAVAFNACIHILENKDDIDKISKIGQINQQNQTMSHLVYGVNNSTSETLDESKNIVDYVYNDLKELSFFNDETFNLLISDVLATVIQNAIPEFDLTNVATEQTIYDVDWPSSFDTVFTFLADAVDLIIDNSFTSQTELIDSIVDTFKNPEHGLAKDLIDMADSSAGAFFLNSQGFNDIMNERLTSALADLINDEDYKIITTNYASYQKIENGNVVNVDGELKKLIRTIGSLLADIVQISTSNLDEQTKTNEMLKVITSDSAIPSLIDDSSDNYSLLIHSILSDVIRNLSFKSESENFSFYLPNEVIKSKYDIKNKEKKLIDSNEFIKIFNFLNSLVSKYSLSDLENGDIKTIINIVNDSVEYIKKSDILLANIALIIYSYKDSASLYIPTRLDLSQSVKEANISNWLGSNGEMNKILNIITFKDSNNNSFLDSFANLFDSNESSADNIILEILKAGEELFSVICDSDVVNGTITSKLNAIDALYIPQDAYKVSGETLKTEEVTSLLNFSKTIFKVTVDTISINLATLSDNIDLTSYSDNLDGLLALFNSNIVNATVSYNIVKISESQTSDIIIPKSLVFAKTDETNLTNWTSTNGELNKLIKSIYYLGLLGSFNNNLNIDDSLMSLLDDSKIDIILDSTIIYATLVNYLNNNKPAGLYIPTKYNTNLASIQNNYENVTYVKNKEINKIIKGLKTLGLEIKNTDFNLSLFKTLNDTTNGQTKLDIILESDILHYTISQYILNQGTSIDIPNSVKTNIDSNDFITKTEVKALVDSINALNLTDFANVEVNTLLSNEIDMDTLLSSGIIHYTISNKLLTNTSINIPTNSKETIDSEDYVKNNEIISLINSIKLLSITDVNSFNENSILSNSFDVTKLLQSNIIWYTISNKLFGLSSIIITDDIVYSENNDNFVEKAELKYFINGATILTSSLDTISVDAATVIDNASTLVKSSIIRNMITKEVLQSNDIVMNRVKNVSSTETIIDTYATKHYKFTNSGITEEEVIVLEELELINFADAIKTIYGGDSSQMTFDVDYSRIDLSTVNISILDSSIILYGLNPTITNAITIYNASALASGKTLYDVMEKYAEDGHEYTIYLHDTLEVKKKPVVSKEMTLDFIENYLNK